MAAGSGQQAVSSRQWAVGSRQWPTVAGCEEEAAKPSGKARTLP